MSLISPNPQEREHALRLLVRRMRDDADLSDADAARALGRSAQLLEKQLRDDGACYVRLSDLPILERLIPGLAGALLAPVGLRVMPASSSGATLDILIGLAEALKRMGAVTQETTSAIPDGIDGAEARAIDRALDALRTTLGELQAGVAAAVVERPVRR